MDDDNPYQSPQTVSERQPSHGGSRWSPLNYFWAFGVGATCATCSTFTAGGGHGTYWWIALTGAPTFLFARLFHMNDTIFLGMYFVGTGVLYAAYARVLVMRPFWIALMTVLVVHGASVAVMMFWSGWSR
ncbi:MAG: hypothetical protein SGJ19_19325 [Planctomycetia bacterium]|nr:hypothetical protein [Planctomycetia bacterium]